MNSGQQTSQKNIQERSFEYALRAIEVYRFLQKGTDEVGQIIGKQYLRSATSIGANVAEAQSGESKADFIHKLSIAQKEARESLYWLQLLARSNTVPKSRLEPLLQETEALIAILTKIIVTTKRNQASK
jgi:four helix bundle protein